MSLRPSLDGLHFYNNLLNPLEKILWRMERDGLLVDKEYFRTQAKKAEEKAAQLEVDIYEWTRRSGKTERVNWRSPDQEVEYLYGLLKLPRSPVCGKGRTKKAQFSTDSAALKYLRDWAKKNRADSGIREGLDKVLTLKKCYSSIKYLRKFPEHADNAGYIHCSMAPDTETFRLAARCPELQQVPVRKDKDEFAIRRGFIAPPGYTYIVVDQSQLEMRILAHILKKRFNDDSLIKDVLAKDCHSQNAIRIWGKVYKGRQVPLARTAEEIPSAPLVNFENLPPDYLKNHPITWVAELREQIKRIAYGLNYGMTKISLGAHLTDEKGEPIGEDMAEVLIEAYKDLYPSLRLYATWCHDFGNLQGGMYSLLGAFRPIPDCMDDRRWVREAGGRQAENTPMQRGAAEIMALGMIRIENCPILKELGCKQRMQIHDEIDAYAPNDTAKEAGEVIGRHLESAIDLFCPLQAKPGYGANWYDAK